MKTFLYICLIGLFSAYQFRPGVDFVIAPLRYIASSCDKFAAEARVDVVTPQALSLSIPSAPIQDTLDYTASIV